MKRSEFFKATLGALALPFVKVPEVASGSEAAEVALPVTTSCSGSITYSNCDGTAYTWVVDYPGLGTVGTTSWTSGSVR